MIVSSALNISELLLTCPNLFKPLIRHGKRSQISLDDVRLMARRNPSLLAAINEFSADFKESKRKK